MPNINDRLPPQQRGRSRWLRSWIGVLAVPALVIVLCFAGWVGSEWYSLRREQQAIGVLRSKFHASVGVPIYNAGPGLEYTYQLLDLWELPRGRLFVPAEDVSFARATVDRRALEQVACFRALKSLTFQDCQLAFSADQLRLTNRDGVKSVAFWNTGITTNHLRSLSEFSHLNSLTLDATNLNGDWLQPISSLHDLRYLYLVNADLSDGAANSLARMKGLEWLQLPGAKIDSNLAPALAGLEKLECLVLDGTPFDDEGMQKLSGLKSLKILSLSQSAITDDGVAAIAKLPKLWNLSLSDTKVGDAGLQELSQLHNLQRLDIIRTRATNLCLQTLAALPKMRHVKVGETAISGTSPGFVGIINDDAWDWYPNAALAKEIEEAARITDDPDDDEEQSE